MLLKKLQIVTADVYRIVGLSSVVILTFVTVISMSNVLTRGQIAYNPVIPVLWAYIYSASIDVNVFRLFIESSSEWTDKRPLAILDLFIASGLGLVTGAAIFIEGIQQSLNISWSDPQVKQIIVVLVGVRVLCVVLLMGREGFTLGVELRNKKRSRTRLQTDTANTKNETHDTSINNEAMSDVISLDTFKSDKLDEILSNTPGITSRELAKHLNCSPATAAKRKKEWLNTYTYTDSDLNTDSV